ncbi:MAG TPA: efflux RND transporter periplasmic adaptor subunit [Holophagaceae bacterium]|nr:efflux RND transporter periplasmic adaptor subunit [Holophagaceae bacterium]
MNRQRKILFAIIGGVIVIASMAAIFGGSGDDSDKFSWDTISKGDIREVISASGEIQAKTRINIGTTIGGEIKAIPVKDGQDVKKGDVLVTLDRVRLGQAVAQASAAVDGARRDQARLKAAMETAESTFKRQDSLRHDGLISEEEWRQAKLAKDSSELSYQTSQTQVAQMAANLGQVQDSLNKGEVRAPIDGKVTSLKAEMGEMAIPGQSNLPGATLMIISDMHEIMAEVKVNESEVVRLHPGQDAQVAVDSLPGRVFDGKVYEVATGSEGGTGQDANMYLVKIALAMSGQDIAVLRPGMSARGVILSRKVEGALRVPLQSVLEKDMSPEDAAKKGLLVAPMRNVVMVMKNGRAEEREVQLGIANTEYFEVKGGLAEGDKVLTGPLRKLRDLKDRAQVDLKDKSDSQLSAEADKRKARSAK